MSWAQSIDGRIATLTGDSRWISGNETLELAHRLRERNGAIVAGIGTVLRDDPELSCRLEDARSQPLRVVLDSRLRFPLESRIAATADRFPTLVVTTGRGAAEAAGKVRQLRDSGISVAEAAEDADGRVDIEGALRILRELGIDGVFVEGGAAVITSFLTRRLVSRLVIVIAPLLIGEGVSAVGDLGVRRLADACRLVSRDFRFHGADGVWDLELSPAGDGTKPGSGTGARP